MIYISWRGSLYSAQYIGSTPCRHLNFEMLILSVIYVGFRLDVERILGTKVLCLAKYS